MNMLQEFCKSSQSNSTNKLVGDFQLCFSVCNQHIFFAHLHLAELHAYFLHNKKKQLFNLFWLACRLVSVASFYGLYMFFINCFVISCITYAHDFLDCIGIVFPFITYYTVFVLFLKVVRMHTTSFELCRIDYW